MHSAAATPEVALPPNFHESAIQWQRRRRIGFAVAAASFVAVIVLSTMRGRTTGSAQTALAASTTAPAPQSTELTESPNGDVIHALPMAVDSLSSALASYRDAAEEHRDGLVSCRVLDRAYARVGRARVRVDSMRRGVDGALSDADSIRVSMLGAEFTHISQMHLRSGCSAL
jgi:hypothetical protein